MQVMSTKNPRISFVPSDEVRALLMRLSAASGRSMASFAAEILQEVAPVMREQLDALEAVQRAPEKAREILRDRAQEAHRRIDQAVLSLERPDGRRTRHRRARDAKTG